MIRNCWRSKQQPDREATLSTSSFSFGAHFSSHVQGRLRASERSAHLHSAVPSPLLCTSTICNSTNCKLRIKCCKPAYLPVFTADLTKVVCAKVPLQPIKRIVGCCVKKALKSLGTASLIELSSAPVRTHDLNAEIKATPIQAPPHTQHGLCDGRASKQHSASSACLGL